jgi:hypothetical protein
MGGDSGVLRRVQAKVFEAEIDFAAQPCARIAQRVTLGRRIPRLRVWIGHCTLR